MIKYKNLCSYNLSMANKNGLTRDEAREAIKILTLRKDNLDIIMMGTLGVLVTLLFITFTIILSNAELSGVFFGYFVEIFILFAVIFIYLFVTFFNFMNIGKKANKLAKDYNLKEFLDAVSNKKISV